MAILIFLFGVYIPIRSIYTSFVHFLTQIRINLCNGNRTWKNRMYDYYDPLKLKSSSARKISRNYVSWKYNICQKKCNYVKSDKQRFVTAQEEIFVKFLHYYNSKNFGKKLILYISYLLKIKVHKSHLKCRGIKMILSNQNKVFFRYFTENLLYQ